MSATITKAVDWVKGLKDALLLAHREESAQDLIEYCLLLSLIALAAVLGLAYIPRVINNSFSSIGNQVSGHAHHDNGKHLGWYK